MNLSLTIKTKYCGNVSFFYEGDSPLAGYILTNLRVASGEPWRISRNPGEDFVITDAEHFEADCRKWWKHNAKEFN